MHTVTWAGEKAHSSSKEKELLSPAKEQEKQKREREQRALVPQSPDLIDFSGQTKSLLTDIANRYEEILAQFPRYRNVFFSVNGASATTFSESGSANSTHSYLAYAHGFIKDRGIWQLAQKDETVSSLYGQIATLTEQLDQAVIERGNRGVEAGTYGGKARLYRS
jgi:hypothetical protein